MVEGEVGWMVEGEVGDGGGRGGLDGGGRGGLAGGDIQHHISSCDTLLLFHTFQRIRLYQFCWTQNIRSLTNKMEDVT